MKEVRVRQPWFDYISLGIKTVEGRLNRGFWKNLNVGEILLFTNGANRVERTISGIKIFKDFGEAYDHYENKLIPNSTREKSIQIYNKIYSDRDINTHGVVCIELEI